MTQCPPKWRWPVQGKRYSKHVLSDTLLAWHIYQKIAIAAGETGLCYCCHWLPNFTGIWPTTIHFQVAAIWDRCTELPPNDPDHNKVKGTPTMCYCDSQVLSFTTHFRTSHFGVTGYFEKVNWTTLKWPSTLQVQRYFICVTSLLSPKSVSLHKPFSDKCIKWPWTLQCQLPHTCFYCVIGSQISLFHSTTICFHVTG